MTLNIGRTALAIGVFGALAVHAGASTIYLGSNGTGLNPLIQILDTSGNLNGNFGANASSAAALDGMGHVYTVTAGDTSSTVYVYDSTQAQVASFVFNSGLDNGNGFANYLTDLTWGGSNLWASAYNGFVYQLSSTGSIISSFDTGVIDTGVTTDGTNLYTTSGLGLLAPSSLIYKRDLQGAVLATIDTGLNDTLGIGFDSSSGTFFVGGLDVVSQVAADGSVLGAFANDGTHTGLEVGDIGTGPGPGDGEVPEPGTVALIGGGLLVIGWRKIRSLRALPIVTLGAVVFATHVVAAVSITSFTPSTNPPAPVGTAITFTTTASDSSAGVLRYRYRVRYNSGAYSTIVSYGPSKTFKWTPADKEGLYDVEVSVINRTTLSTASTSKPFLATSRVTGGPTVTSTVHPLVALYSAPSCPAGAMRVRFKTASQAYWQSTSTKPCNGSTSMNFYVGGMYPSTTYTMRNDVINGPQITTSGDVTFTTSAASPSLPATTATIPLQPPTSMTEGISLFSSVLGANIFYALDANARLLWYLPGTYNYGTKPTPGGTFLVVYGTLPLETAGFREYDLAGNTIKDTNVEQVNVQLAQMGKPFSINAIHHEARRLPNGNYMMLASTEVVSGAQGPTTSILGDVILVMNNNLDVLWTWNSFDHLDVTRKAILGETCMTGQGGCVVLKGTTANDWLHGNSVAPTPDGNIVYSARHQDLIYKIEYQNGAGDGHVIWKLGKDGDFTWHSTDPYPWQSHQHDAEYEGTSNTLSLFDNGNTRVASSGGNSRGQVMQIDEVSRAVTLVLNANLGIYSAALGSAQKLSNGNYSFDAGLGVTQSSEVNKSGAIAGQLANSASTYRTFRLRDLYSAPW